MRTADHGQLKFFTWTNFTHAILILWLYHWPRSWTLVSATTKNRESSTYVIKLLTRAKITKNVLMNFTPRRLIRSCFLSMQGMGRNKNSLTAAINCGQDLISHEIHIIEGLDLNTKWYLELVNTTNPNSWLDLWTSTHPWDTGAQERHIARQP